MLEIIRKYKIVPVIVLKNLDDTIPTLKALKEGGLPIAEITFRTACAEDAVKLAVKEFPDMLIGAGTIISKEQCQAAISAGAKFIVSPGLSEEVSDICKDAKTPYIPGVITPTEIIKAVSLGLRVLKFFPAESFGGLKAIKALSSAFPQIMFMPTGGINENNLIEYLSFEKIIACGSSWMLSGTTDEIKQKVKAIMKKIKD
jgi:2-dehydro-3-deoxyphosphogluconate aldolase/(4S)-4-hydroxy-2-oxoglutarate aldolase